MDRLDRVRRFDRVHSPSRLNIWRSAHKTIHRDRREPRRARKAMCRQVYSRVRGRTRRETRFVVSDIFLGSGNNRTGLGQDCRCTGCHQVDVDARINRCACTLKEYHYKLRAGIDTKWMRKKRRHKGRREKSVWEREKEGKGGWRVKMDKFNQLLIYVIVMGKLLNLPLMLVYGICVKSIAFQRFIELNSGELSERF